MPAINEETQIHSDDGGHEVASSSNPAHEEDSGKTESASAPIAGHTSASESLSGLYDSKYIGRGLPLV